MGIYPGRLKRLCETCMELHAHAIYHSVQDSNNNNFTLVNDVHSTKLLDESLETQNTAQQVLTVQDVSPVETITIASTSELDQNIIDVARENRDHTIHDFLNRYRVVARVTESAGGVNGDMILALNFPDALLQLEPIRQKVKGFLYLRSNIMIKIVITAPPTCAGGLRIVQAPDIAPTVLADRLSTPLGQSQFPNRIASIASMPSVELNIPWVSQYTHRNLTENFPTPQHLYIFKASPISHTFSVVVYAAFDIDKEFSLTQATAAQPYYDTFAMTRAEYDDYVRCVKKEKEEAARKERWRVENERRQEERKKKEEEERIRKEKEEEEKKLREEEEKMRKEEEDRKRQNLPGRKPYLQSQSKHHKSKVIAKPQSEAQQASGGLSMISDTVGNVAHVLKGVPIVGGIASAVEPIAHLASHIFSAFGWSKPQADEPVKAIKQQAVPSHVTCDGVSVSQTVGVSTLNKISEVPGIYGSETDDMSFEKICRHPNFVQNFEVSTSSTTGQVILALPINTNLGCTTPHPQETTFGIARFTHQAFVANMFRYWLASVVLDFHLFTTSMHSVKLRFAAVPGHYTSSAAGLSFDDTNSVVVNFGANTNHQIVFPEVTNRQMLRVRYPHSLLNPSLNPNSNDTIGYLFVVVEIPLHVTSTIVSPVVNGLVQVSYRNPRFAVMSNSSFEPVYDPVTLESQAGDEVYGSDTSRSTASIVEDGEVTANNVDAPKDNLMALALTAGEAIVNMRQIVKQATGMRRFATVANQAYVYRPFHFSTSLSDGTSTEADIIDYVKSAFGFSRGSMIVRVFVKTGGDDFLIGAHMMVINNAISKLSNFATSVGSTNDAQRARFRGVVSRVGNDGILDVHVPYYQPYHMVRNVPSSLVSTISENIAETSGLIFRAHTDNTYISRAAGDDFSCGYLIGLPAFLVRTNNVIRAPPNIT